MCRILVSEKFHHWENVGYVMTDAGKKPLDRIHVVNCIP